MLKNESCRDPYENRGVRGFSWPGTKGGGAFGEENDYSGHPERKESDEGEGKERTVLRQGLTDQRDAGEYPPNGGG